MSQEQFAADVELNFYSFFKSHFRRDRLSSCQANRAILEAWCDENLLDVSKPESLEIAYLAVGSQLARTSTPQPPVPPAPSVPVVEAQALSEQDELRKVLRDHPGDARAVANAMRARLKVADVHNQESRTALPVDYTRKRLLAMSGPELRATQKRWGFEVIDARLNGKR